MDLAITCSPVCGINDDHQWRQNSVKVLLVVKMCQNSDEFGDLTVTFQNSHIQGHHITQLWIRIRNPPNVPLVWEDVQNAEFSRKNSQDAPLWPADAAHITATTVASGPRTPQGLFTSISYLNMASVLSIHLILGSSMVMKSRKTNWMSSTRNILT